MMPAVMMNPMGVKTPGAMIADLLRTMAGYDDAAAGRRVITGIFVIVGIVVIIRIVVPDASDEDAPDVMAASEPMSAMPAAADKRGTGMERGAMSRRATATKPAMAAAVTTTATTMSAVNFDHGIVGRDFFHGDSTGIDQGECFGALAGYCR
jgi:hypothetical protein